MQVRYDSPVQWACGPLSSPNGAPHHPAIVVLLKAGSQILWAQVFIAPASLMAAHARPTMPFKVLVLSCSYRASGDAHRDGAEKHERGDIHA